MDRLSCLPDDVICHILSFLLTLCSVRTSVLSKRWRFLWAHVPFLSFAEVRVKSETITEILLQHKHDIHTFILDDDDLDCSEEDFGSWFADITTRKIRILALTLYHQYKLPQCLITCKTLTDLWLGGNGCYIPMSGIYFPALKKLRLNDVRYESNESLAHLISGCPVLEKLRIVGEMLGHCCISSPTLTKLVLSPYFEVVGFRVELNTPALTYLYIEMYMPDIFSVEALDSLIEADIELSWDERQHDKFAYSRNLLALVGKLYNVKVLRFHVDPIEMIHSSAFSALAAKFHNLTQLRLVSNLVAITIFLENNNNLRVLDLTILSMVDAGNQYYWMPEQVPTCLASHLQTVTVNPFDCSEEAFDFVRYILMNAKVLKRMEICTILHGDDWKTKFEALQRLALFERGSKKCQLAFS